MPKKQRRRERRIIANGVASTSRRNKMKRRQGREKILRQTKREREREIAREREKEREDGIPRRACSQQRFGRPRCPECCRRCCCFGLAPAWARRRTRGTAGRRSKTLWKRSTAQGPQLRCERKGRWLRKRRTLQRAPGVWLGGMCTRSENELGSLGRLSV